MSIREVEMNERDKKVLATGDIGQGDYLVDAKQKNKKPNNFRWFILDLFISFHLIL